MSIVLGFASGKVWTAEVVETIANRYLSFSARVVAERVWEGIDAEGQTHTFNSEMSPLSVVSSSLNNDQVISSADGWAPSSSDGLHAYITEGKMDLVGIAVKPEDEGILHDP
jgi:hypothetical protein